jgi:hypothetical protein
VGQNPGAAPTDEDFDVRREEEIHISTPIPSKTAIARVFIFSPHTVKPHTVRLDLRSPSYSILVQTRKRGWYPTQYQHVYQELITTLSLLLYAVFILP